MDGEYFNLRFNQTPIGAAIVGLDGTLLSVNDFFCSILGYTRDELTHLDPSSAEYSNLRDLLACVEEAARTLTHLDTEAST